ncbi:NADH dehydrogenase [ubiquinone] 1 beta subcomplex subunit 1 [Hylaeus volcanicus]|uniref:NADH dehydrogenase [ubiquinone] 1 beta subcomplex subunit 1 n=1 Tax=Hylaeus volcanicus TaxID=313075 RepID=UPI0023B8147D|nr:NADH dehydrogenase [ubiquinone] 1 beta subcomplex subunit 1 [Hylaeus volcanicus]
MSAASKRLLIKAYAQYLAGIAVAGTLGFYYNRMESERLSCYRDKSALFGRELKPGEAPSWP